jgi:hypothetical protein
MAMIEITRPAALTELGQVTLRRLIGLAELAYNKHPLYLVGPWNLAQRFLMHGFFTEYLYARLEEVRSAGTPTSADACVHRL